MPRRDAKSSEHTITQEAPSLTPGAFPAVVVPSGSKTGGSAPPRSAVGPRPAPRSSGVEDRRERPQPLERRVAPDALVRGHAADRDDLVVEPAGVLCRRGALL